MLNEIKSRQFFTGSSCIFCQSVWLAWWLEDHMRYMFRFRQAQNGNFLTNCCILAGFCQKGECQKVIFWYHRWYLRCYTYYSSFYCLIFTNNWIILQVIIGSILAVVYGQRCDKGSKVCVKLEADDPVFQGQRCKVPSDCKGLY